MCDWSSHFTHVACDKKKDSFLSDPLQQLRLPLSKQNNAFQRADLEHVKIYLSKKQPIKDTVRILVTGNELRFKDAYGSAEQFDVFFSKFPAGKRLMKVICIILPSPVQRSY